MNGAPEVWVGLNVWATRQLKHGWIFMYGPPTPNVSSNQADLCIELRRRAHERANHTTYLLF
jgi:hypothetical protein